STVSRRRAIPSSAARRRRVPSKSNGLVTTPTVRAPAARACLATTGAAPVPVPPPIPAGRNTSSPPPTLSPPPSGLPPAPPPALRPASRTEPLGQLVADAHVHRRLAPHEGLGVGVDRDKLDTVDSGINHAVDGIATGAADADHLDMRERFAYDIVPG